ncbi:MAG: PIG-L family deacetylase [Chloroflexota bacterium]|nr:PIG-L family deacetylase [Chloroflexota bacterium]
MATVLFVYAHPDDESFGIAGTAMKLADAGHATAMLTLTRGAAGLWFGREPGSWTPRELAEERAHEWRAAVEEIGFRHSRLLEWPDGGVSVSPMDDVTGGIVEYMRELRPDVVCTFGPEGAGSEHDDHRATSFLAARAFARAAIAEQYTELGPAHAAQRLFFNAAPPFSGEHLAYGALSPTHSIEMGAYRDRKVAAFECHKTQFKDRDRFYEMLDRRTGKEHFHLAIDRSGAPARGDDLLT